jgi:hypothetical protein
MLVMDALTSALEVHLACLLIAKPKAVSGLMKTAVLVRILLLDLGSMSNVIFVMMFVLAKVLAMDVLMSVLQAPPAAIAIRQTVNGTAVMGAVMNLSRQISSTSTVMYGLPDLCSGHHGCQGCPDQCGESSYCNIFNADCDVEDCSWDSGFGTCEDYGIGSIKDYHEFCFDDQDVCVQK